MCKTLPDRPDQPPLEGEELTAAVEEELKQQVAEANVFNEDDPYEAMFAHLDYSKRSVEPKVMPEVRSLWRVLMHFRQVNYISGRPGDPPRKVEIERKRREFSAQDLTKLLLEKGDMLHYCTPAED